jgi:RNA polymerase sigma-70 factor, ECF subfamily
MPALDPMSLPRHLDRLYRAAWALCGSPHDAEDLVQETFARVLARPRLLRGQDELAYLMTVLRNTFLTQRRTAARRPRTGASPLEDIDPVDPRITSRPAEALQAREVFTAIAGLSESYRMALVAVDVAGLSYREAGGVLGTREATIATRVFRARQQVARELNDAEQARPLTPGQRAPADGPAPAAASAPTEFAELDRSARRAERPPVGSSSMEDSKRNDLSAPREDAAARRRLIQRGPR